MKGQPEKKIYGFRQTSRKYTTLKKAHNSGRHWGEKRNTPNAQKKHKLYEGKVATKLPGVPWHTMLYKTRQTAKAGYPFRTKEKDSPN